MWLLGSNSRFREVPGGRVAERHCDECDQVRTFVECEVKDKVSVFFVPVMDMSSRRLVCRECGEDQELPEPEPAPPTKTSGPPPASKPPSRPSEQDLDRMLAELKKNMPK
jgi:hypothetical protein